MGRHKGTDSRFSHMPWEWGFRILLLYYVLCFGTAVDILMALSLSRQYVWAAI